MNLWVFATASAGCVRLSAMTLTTAVPTTVVPSYTVTVLPASALPVRVRVVSLVTLSVALGPVSCETETSVG